MKEIVPLIDFDDITLLPTKISTINSRSECDLTSKLGNSPFSFPIIASPMRDVCDGNIAKICHGAGGLGIIHRFLSIEEQKIEFEKAGYGGCAIGINGDYEERFKVLVDAGCTLFCLDVANGANRNVAKAIERLYSLNDKATYIVGNVASAHAFTFLEEQPNVVGIRCGIAGGTACTTKNATGIYHPMISLLRDCYEAKDHAAIIADGGLNSINRICKAFAVGADFVMLGRLIAGTDESPAQEYLNDFEKCVLSQNNTQILGCGRKWYKYKIYRGSASHEIQNIYRENPRYIEGTTTFIPYEECLPIQDLFTRIRDGLQSSMSYADARTLAEYRENIEIGRIN